MPQCDRQACEFILFFSFIRLNSSVKTVLKKPSDFHVLLKGNFEYVLQSLLIAGLTKAFSSGNCNFHKHKRSDEYRTQFSLEPSSLLCYLKTIQHKKGKTAIFTYLNSPANCFNFTCNLLRFKESRNS